jgi:hypothetical protein
MNIVLYALMNARKGLVDSLVKRIMWYAMNPEKLKEHERNYTTHDLELEMIVHALKMSRHYLVGKKFEIRKDHCGMNHFFGQPILNAKKTKWLEFQSKYDFKIKNIKGKENQVVDVLSRRSHEVCITTIIMYKTYIKNKFIVATNSNKNYLKIKETFARYQIYKIYKT